MLAEVAVRRGTGGVRHRGRATDGAVVGMAIHFRNFSTWTGRLGIYLEDLYVRPDAPGPRASGGPCWPTWPDEARAHGLRPHRLVGVGLERVGHPLLRVHRGGADGRVDRVPAVRRGAGGAGVDGPSEEMRRADWRSLLCGACQRPTPSEGSEDKCH